MAASQISLLVCCNNLEEAGVATRAIEAYRAGHGGLALTAGAPDPTAALAERLIVALGKAPPSKPKEIILRMLSDAEPDTWVTYPDMQNSFEKQGLDKERAAAALRDLSWQMREFLPPGDVAHFSRKIEVLAERSRAGGTYQYRLTKAGRAALDRLYNKR
jgi:hypothetical protein